MTKEQLIELVTTKLSGGNKTPDQMGKYHPLVIEKYIEMAFNQIYYDTFRKNLSDLDIYAIAYDNVDVLFDSIRSVYYSNFPAQLVQLPNNAMIRKVSYQQDQSNEIVPVHDNSRDVFAGLEVGDVDMTSSYSVTGERIEFIDYIEDFDKVLIKAIPTFSELDDTTNIYIPSGKDLDFFNIVAQMTEVVKPEDVINDNNSKQV